MIKIVILVLTVTMLSDVSESAMEVTVKISGVNGYATIWENSSTTLNCSWYNRTGGIADRVTFFFKKKTSTVRPIVLCRLKDMDNSVFRTSRGWDAKRMKAMHSKHLRNSTFLAVSISNVSCRDSGEYSCEVLYKKYDSIIATRNSETNSSNLNVSVLKRDIEKPTLISVPSKLDKAIPQGTTLHFICVLHLGAFQGQGTIVWRKHVNGNITYLEASDESVMEKKYPPDVNNCFVQIQSYLSFNATKNVHNMVVDCTLKSQQKSYTLMPGVTDCEAIPTCAESQQIKVLVPPGRPTLNVHFHEAPNITYRGKPLDADCSANVGFEGDLIWVMVFPNKTVYPNKDEELSNLKIDANRARETMDDGTVVATSRLTIGEISDEHGGMYFLCLSHALEVDPNNRMMHCPNTTEDQFCAESKPLQLKHKPLDNQDNKAGAVAASVCLGLYLLSSRRGEARSNAEHL